MHLVEGGTRDIKNWYLGGATSFSFNNFLFIYLLLWLEANYFVIFMQIVKIYFKWISESMVFISSGKVLEWRVNLTNIRALFLMRDSRND
jgi:hypothetical protein